MTPRCGKPMTRYEASNGPMPEEPSCGRPAGHRGRCRSVPAWVRQLNAARDPRVCGCGCGEVTAGWGPCKTGHHMRLLAEVSPVRAELNRAALEASTRKDVAA